MASCAVAVCRLVSQSVFLCTFYTHTRARQQQRSVAAPRERGVLPAGHRGSAAAAAGTLHSESYVPTLYTAGRSFAQSGALRV
ncbi:hypothetical protein JKP88DRAFT_228757 [Tribonema minus]|uniref:Uncharacterized protein n=1 Tax=Tribonema minus TaxID=303371 RepID=A0A835YQW2_9STRA|nr:hypothetical protein JKP88DRAFT_228757 [Tribonema minus]